MLDVRVEKKQGTFKVRAVFRTDTSDVTVLFGASGAGKTSVVNMVAGLIRPDRGRIVIGDRVCFDETQKINLPPEKRRIGYVFQESRLFPHLTVNTNLTFGMKRVPPKDRFINYQKVVELLGIGPLLHRRPAKLSGGEKQRVAIGRALLCSPLLLLMDEPLASLDQARKKEILPFIRTLNQEFHVPILYISHQIEEINGLADRLVLLKNGAVTASGPAGDLLCTLED